MHPSLCVQPVVCSADGHLPPSLRPKAKPKSCAHLTVPLALPWVDKSQEHLWFAPGTGRKAHLLPGQLVPGLVLFRTGKSEVKGLLGPQSGPRFWQHMVSPPVLEVGYQAKSTLDLYRGPHFWNCPSVHRNHFPAAAPSLSWV